MTGVSPAHVLIVVNGVRGQQIVFCYPPPIIHSTLANAGEHLPSSTVPNTAPSASAAVSSKTASSSGETNASSEAGGLHVGISSPPIDQLFGIQASALSSVLAPRKKLLVNRTLTLSIDNLQFIALPTSIHERNVRERAVIAMTDDELGDADNVFDLDDGRRYETEEERLFGAAPDAHPASGDGQHYETNPSSTQQRHSETENGHGESNEITDMCIVFVFDKYVDICCKTNHERELLLSHYSHLLVQVTMTYLREQRRCGYLNRELDFLAKCREQCQGGTWFDLSKIVIHDRKSEMALEMVKIMDSLRSGQLLQLRINKWIDLHWRLDDTFHRDGDELSSFRFQEQQKQRYSQFPLSLASKRDSGGSNRKNALSAAPNMTFQTVRPYHACTHVQSLPKNIHFEFDGIEDIQRVWKKITPVRNMQEIAKETNMSVGLVCSIASHLVDWGMVRLLKSRLTSFTILALDPCGPYHTLDFSSNSSLLNDFANTFDDVFDLPSVLEGFSMARSYRSHFEYLLSNVLDKKQKSKLEGMSPSQQQETFINLVDWLLQHHLLEIRNTYVQLVNPHIFNQSISHDGQQMPLSDLEVDYIESIISLTEVEDHEQADLFRRLCVYFNGKFNIDEIIWLEGVLREELKVVLNVFKDALLEFSMWYVWLHSTLTGLIPSGITVAGNHVLSVGRNKLIYCSTTALYVHRMDDFSLERIITGHARPITSISTSARHPTLFASGSHDKTIRIWNIETGKEEQRIDLKGFLPLGLDWSPFDRDIIIAGGKGGFRVYDRKKNIFFSINISTTHYPTHVSFNPKVADRIFVGLEDGAVVMLSLSQKKTLFSWRATNSPITGFEWDPFSENYLLVTYANGRIALFDTQQESTENFRVMQFDKVTGGVSCVSMMEGEPGNFVTGDRRTGTLRKWNISQSEPLEVIRVGTSGIKECVTIPDRGQIALGLLDGTVCVYDLRKKKIVHSTTKGHVETIFDVAVCRTDPDIFATSSFDGKIKLWRIDSMHLVDQFSLDSAVFGISWHPLKKIIAAALGDGHIAIIDAKTGQTITKFRMHNDIVYKVAWNSLDPNMIASSSKDSTVCVFQENGKLVAKYRHPQSVFGIAWSAHEKHMLATGCHDFQVRLFDLSSGMDTHTKLFKGHTAEVYNVSWNPILPGTLVSGSNDRTLRVWNINSGDSKVLRGHKDNVRALHWSHELSNIVISGSWDGTIRVWDVSSGVCHSVANEHHADVYGLDSHPQRPFAFVSTSRDTTIRVWGMRDIVEYLLLRALMKKSLSVIMQESSENQRTADPGGEIRTEFLLKLSGQQCKIINNKIQSCNSDYERYSHIFEFFSPVPVVKNLWGLVSIRFSKRLPPNKEVELCHGAFMSSLVKSRALELTVKARSQKGKVNSRKITDILTEAAHMFLLVGETKSYCDIMVELGEWERAIAIAPSVSLNYWREQCNRYAIHLAEQESEEAVPFLAASCQVDKLVNLLTYREQLDDAIVVARRGTESGFQQADDADVTESTTGDKDSPIFPAFDIQPSTNLTHTIELKAAKLMHNADPIRAACSYLSIDDVAKAIRVLLKGNEIYLAYALSHVYGIDNSDNICSIMAYQCSKYSQWDNAIKFIQKISDPNMVLLTISQMNASANQTDNIYIQCGFQPTSFYQSEALSLESSNIIEAIRCHVLARNNEQAAKIAIRFLQSQLGEETWNWSKIQKCAAFMQCVDLSNVGTALIQEFLALVNFVSGHQALWRGYYSVAACMFDNVEKLMVQRQLSLPGDYVRWMKCLAYSKCDDVQCIKCIEDAIDKVRDSEVIQCMKDLKSRIYSNVAMRSSPTTSREPNLVIPTASNLPTRTTQGKCVNSIISNREARGPLVILEDSKTYITLAEAIMWKNCNLFSPLLNGKKLRL